MGKIVNLTIILVLTFAFTFALPQKEANAFAFAAVPAGITVGAGAYTVGALALAGVVGIAGYDTYSEEINAHALRAWENGTQLSKDSMNGMINAANGAGMAIQNFGTDFANWYEQFGITDMASRISALDQIGIVGNVGGTTSSYEGVMTGVLSETFTLPEGAVFILNGQEMSSIKISFKGTSTWYIETIGAAGEIIRSPSWTNTVNPKQATSLLFYTTNAGTFIAMMNAFSGLTLGLKNNGVVSDLPAVQMDLSTKFREAWQGMRDAGLVLPVDNVVPSYEGNAVNYNADTDVYTGVDGGVLNPADLTWSFPQPRIRTGEELDVTVPPGVYVDNPAGVYSPSLPTTAYPDIAVPMTTSITTGLSTPITNTGTGEPPPVKEPVPKSEPVNPFNAKPIPIAALTGLFQLLAALIFYLIRLFTFIATIAFIAPTPIDNPYFLWFIDATFYGIKPFPLVQNLALFFLGFSVYRSVRRVFG